MPKKPQGPSQLMELFLTVAAELGFDADRDLAALADVGPENVANWRSGAVKEFKNQKFRSALANLQTQLRSLRAQAGLLEGGDELAMSPLEIEKGSSPSELQRQFRDRVVYDYLGHRFLYFEPQGALAWENLIRAGYEQEVWLSGVDSLGTKWLDHRRDSGGNVRGPIARALGLDRRDRARGFDIISLGPGEGGKEVLLLDKLLQAGEEARARPNWITFAPVDVSIALLLRAADGARRVFFGEGREGRAYRSVLPFCADFEEGSLSFLRRLRTSFETEEEGVRLVLLLGNVIGNLRDEETFVRQKLWKIARPGDLVWIEVGLRLDPLEDDPVYKLTLPDHTETAGEANRRLLLEGPYRRWAVATGRTAPDLGLRVWVREDDDSSRVPGSYNFCHDLLINDENRVVTMLYSRRYTLDSLAAWWEAHGFTIEGIQRIRDSRGRERVGHILLRRKELEG